MIDFGSSCCCFTSSFCFCYFRPLQSPQEKKTLYLILFEFNYFFFIYLSQATVTLVTALRTLRYVNVPMKYGTHYGTAQQMCYRWLLFLNIAVVLFLSFLCLFVTCRPLCSFLIHLTTYIRSLYASYYIFLTYTPLTLCWSNDGMNANELTKQMLVVRCGSVCRRSRCRCCRCLTVAVFVGGATTIIVLSQALLLVSAVYGQTDKLSARWLVGSTIVRYLCE